jgi:hypothetical protein
MRLFPVLVLCAMSVSAFAANPKVLKLLRQYANPMPQDLILTDGTASPSVNLGAAVVPVPGDDGTPSQETQIGGTSCTMNLTPRVDDRARTALPINKMHGVFQSDWKLGIKLSFSQFDLGGSGGKFSAGGLDWSTWSTATVEPQQKDMDMFVECCVQHPAECLGTWFDPASRFYDPTRPRVARYVSEAWKGDGKRARLVETEARGKVGIPDVVNQLEVSGELVFSIEGGFSVVQEWSDAWFAYKTQQTTIPSCGPYLDTNPEPVTWKHTLPAEPTLCFVGVGEWSPLENDARERARDDARKQVVRYLGTQYQLAGDEVSKASGGVVSELKDSFLCLDAQRSEQTGPAYQARVRMCLPKAKLDAAALSLRPGR